MPERLINQHPRFYRFLLHALPFVIALNVVAVFAVAFTAKIVADRGDSNKAAICGLLRLAQTTSKTALVRKPEQLEMAQAYYRKALRLADCPAGKDNPHERSHGR